MSMALGDHGISVTSAHARARARRRANASARVVHPVSAETNDPLAPVAARPARQILGGIGALGIAAALHGAVLAFFLLTNLVGEWLADEPEPAGPEVSALAVETPPEEVPDEPPPEEPPPPPPPQIPSVIPPPERPKAAAAPAQAMGLTADSTSEGGSGPAFRTGAGLVFDSQSLAQQLLGPADATAPAELVMTADSVDTPPKPASGNRQPKMPSRAVKKQLSGVVVLRLLIDGEGSVRDVKILQSEPAGVFDEAVLEVASSWRFTPATYKGQPVEIRVDQTFRFNAG